MLATAVALVLLAPTAAPGGDVKPCVEKGLMWLADRQQADGNWAGRNDRYPTTTTALAALALLMEGSTLKEGAYAGEIQKALAWVENNASDSGLLANSPGDNNRSIHGHAYALLFLASVYDADDDPARRKRLAKLLGHAVTFTESAQGKRGGWGTVSLRDRPDGDDSQSTVLMLQGLFAARRAGIEVPKALTDAGTDYLVRATSPTTGGLFTRPTELAPRTTGTGVALLTAGTVAAHLMHDGPRPPAFPRWVANLKSAVALRPAGTISGTLSAHYHMARVAFALGDTGHRRLDPGARDADLIRWSSYRAAAHPLICGEQFPDGNWADQVNGTVYATSLALIILQLDNSYLPAFAR